MWYTLPVVRTRESEGTWATDIVVLRGAAPGTIPLASVVLPAPRLPMSSTTARARQLARQPLAECHGLLFTRGAVSRHTPPWRSERYCSRSVASRQLLPSDLRAECPASPCSKPPPHRLVRLPGELRHEASDHAVRMSARAALSHRGACGGLIHTRPSAKRDHRALALEDQGDAMPHGISARRADAGPPGFRRFVLPVRRAISPGCGVEDAYGGTGRFRLPTGFFPLSRFTPPTSASGPEPWVLGSYRLAHAPSPRFAGRAPAQAHGDHALAARQRFQAGVERDACRIRFRAAARSSTRAHARRSPRWRWRPTPRSPTPRRAQRRHPGHRRRRPVLPRDPATSST